MAFAQAAFEAYWRDDQDISNDAVLTQVRARAGVDAAAFFSGIARPEAKDQLKANTDELIRRGGFGSPTMFVNGADMYFGNNRLALVRAALLHGGRASAK